MNERGEVVVGGAMRLVLRIRSVSTKSWRELLGSPPASLWRAETADGGFVIAQPDDEHAVTGLRLTRDGGVPAVALPLFCGSSDLSLAQQLTPILAPPSLSNMTWAL